MKVLDLFSGIGGFSLGLERAGMETIAFCEIEPFCQEVLAKHWPNVPIFKDVRTLKGDELGTVDVICGGYPCQPFSLAGKRAGADDDRHLWPEVHRLLQETGASWFIGENVAGHISMGLDEVLSDLEDSGYTAQTFIIPACAKDAPHRRDRTWVVAHNDGTLCDRNTEHEVCTGRDAVELCADTLADTGSARRQKQHVATIAKGARFDTRSSVEIGREAGWWSSEPAVGRVANGIPRRVDRLRALGNAVVPQIPEQIGRAIIAVNALRLV